MPPALTPRLTEGPLDLVRPEEEKRGIPVPVLVPQLLAGLMGRIAGRHPGLKPVMEHCALTGGKDGEAFCDCDELLALAAHANIAVKVICLAFFATDAYPYRFLHPYIRRVYDGFGLRRTFWGSDLSRLSCTSTVRG